MSCLMLRPSCVCASEISSRSAHSDRRCAVDCAITASLARPVSIACAAQRFEQAAGVRFVLVVADLEQNVLRAPIRKGRGVAGIVALDQRQAQIVEALERRQCRSANGAGGLQQVQRCGQCGHSKQGGRLGAWQRVGLQAGCSDDAKRALGADEKVAQVVAGVVLAQAAQPVPDFAVWQHDFESKAKLARVAVAQDLHTTGVGAEVAADRGTCPRPPTKAERVDRWHALHPALRPACSRPRPSESRWWRRPRGSAASASARRRSHARLPQVWRRRRARCCRPAALPACRSSRTTR